MSIAKQINDILNEKFQPQHLEIVNESYKHNVPDGSETHFKVLIVSEFFEGVPLIKQHRMVNDSLKELFDKGLHALSIKTSTPSKFKESDLNFKTPPCLGGSSK